VPAVTPAPMVEVSGLTRRHGDQVALDDVSLSVAAGQFVALVGPSGSGKTSLLKSINGLIRPDSGSIRVSGREVADVPAAKLRRGIGYVFQGIGLFPHFSVAENIWIVPKLSGADLAERDARVAELLALTALPAEFAGRSPRQLSGGQAQRVGVARALAAGAKLMLMDEPFGALDPVTRDELGRAYRELHDRLGLTTLMVTHDMAEALLLADRVVVLVAGRIRADASRADLLRGSAEAEVQAMLDLPRRQARQLAELAR